MMTADDHAPHATAARRRLATLGRQLLAPVSTSAASPNGMVRLSAPRLAPLPKEQCPKELGENPSPFQATLAHHPELVKKWLPLAMYVVGGSTIARGKFTRQRNLALARTSWLLCNDYAFHAYVNMGHGRGADKGELSAADVAAVGAGSADPHWASSELDRATLKAAEELNMDAGVSDATWAALLKNFDEVKNAVDLVASCGWYTLNSMMENTLGVQKNPPPQGGHHVTDLKARAGRVAGPVSNDAPRPQAPRLAPLEEGKNANVSNPRDGRTLNVLKTLNHHKDLNKPFGQWAFHVMGKTSTISNRLRELAILRIGWLCNSKYEWNQHVWIAEDGPGLTTADFHAVEAGPQSAHWNETERLVLQATDELRSHCFISEATWKQMEGVFSLQQRLDIMASVGQYNLVSFVLNSLGVQLEDWVTPHKGGPKGEPYLSEVGRFKYFDGKYN